MAFWVVVGEVGGDLCGGEGIGCVGRWSEGDEGWEDIDVEGMVGEYGKRGGRCRELRREVVDGGRVCGCWRVLPILRTDKSWKGDEWDSEE